MPLRLTQRRLAFTALAAVVTVIAVGWLASWYYSFDQRFARSKPALEAYARQVMATARAAPVPQPPQPLGAFHAANVERLPHGFLFFCDYGHPLDDNGIAYSTEPQPHDIGGHDFFRHIEGNWYMADRN